MTTLRTRSGRKITGAMEVFVQRVKGAAPEAALDAVEVLADAVREKYSQPGSGRMYPSATGSGMHQASAPGEPPAPDTWALHDSVYTELVGRTAVAGSDDPVAAYLELGTQTILPRPAWRPALAESIDQMTQRVRARMRNWDSRVQRQRETATGRFTKRRRGAGNA